MSSKKRKVNVHQQEKVASTSSTFPDHQSSSQVTEVTALTSQNNPTTDEKFLTLSGTIKRGNKAGQQVDVKVNVSRLEIERLQEKDKSKLRATNPIQSSSRYCSWSSGLHILIWTLLCAPLVFVISSIYSFYIGTMTWYNIMSLYAEETLFYRILAAPTLILTYPFLIFVCTFGMGIYAALEQITFKWAIWITRVQDLEKGFYSWLCQKVHLEECAPYTEVIIVNQLPDAITQV